jgi:hypothetical protein
LAVTATLHTTGHHQFWDQTNASWTDAADLQPGQSTLTTPDGTTVQITAVTSHTGEQLMRDLTVADIHTYYVIAGDTPVLVHNCLGEELYGRAKELNGTRASPKNSTTAVAKVRSTADPNVTDTWVATEHPSIPNEWRGNMPNGTERLIRGPGHAETTILDALGDDWELVGIASSTRICPTCFGRLLAYGLSPSMVGYGRGHSSTGNTPYRVMLSDDR